MRPGMSTWNFVLTGCVENPRGAMRITTPSGTTIDGVATQHGHGSVLIFGFDVTGASREYSGGHLEMTIDPQRINAIGIVAGTLFLA